MHDYSMDKHPKEKILFGLAFISITLTPIINNFLQEMGTRYHLSIGIFSVLALYSCFVFLFDKCLWKIESLRKALLVPDLNGKWDCQGETIFKSGQQTSFNWNGEITIVQSWTKIQITLNTKESGSKSVSGSIFYDRGIGYKLLYQYQNFPIVGVSDMKPHTGAVELIISEDCKSGDGHYYTDHQRSTVGTMKIRKKNA